MATVLEECTMEKQLSVVRFLWAKGLNVKKKELGRITVVISSKTRAILVW
jgi:hypothetical protein